MELLSIGTEVTLNQKVDFKGTITGISIRENGIQYEVTWWADRTRNTAWMYECEFNHAAEKTRIGFRGEA